MQLAACVFSGYDIARFFGNRAGRLAAKRFDQVVDLLAGIKRQTARSHNGLACQQIAFRGFFSDKINACRTQLFNEHLRLLERTPRGDTFRSGLPDIADGGHFLHRRRQQRIQTAEMVAQHPARFLADVPDPEGEQQPRQVTRFACLDAAQQVVRPCIHLFAER